MFLRNFFSVIKSFHPPTPPPSPQNCPGWLWNSTGWRFLIYPSIIWKIVIPCYFIVTRGNTHLNPGAIIRGYHMGGSVIWFLSNEWWCDITNERGTSEWVISHQHEFDKIISQCHPCDYLFIIYHNTRTNRNFVHTYHSHIYYTSTYCHFLTFTNFRLLELSNATSNAQYSVWRVVAKKIKK